ncbi:hypothetical protein OH77DRAFT_620107 [Trametes cingulata]|nr:hypothetical protein OH77DRAFT_620107 [Trametes cingulata]
MDSSEYDFLSQWFNTEKFDADFGEILSTGDEEDVSGPQTDVPNQLTAPDIHSAPGMPEPSVAAEHSFSSYYLPNNTPPPSDGPTAMTYDASSHAPPLQPSVARDPGEDAATPYEGVVGDSEGAVELAARSDSGIVENVGSLNTPVREPLPGLLCLSHTSL